MSDPQTTEAVLCGAAVIEGVMPACRRCRSGSDCSRRLFGTTVRVGMGYVWYQTMVCDPRDGSPVSSRTAVRNGGR